MQKLTKLFAAAAIAAATAIPMQSAHAFFWGGPWDAFAWPAYTMGGYPGWGYPGYGWGYPAYGWGYPAYGWGYPYYGYPVAAAPVAAKAPTTSSDK